MSRILLVLTLLSVGGCAAVQPREVVAPELSKAKRVAVLPLENLTAAPDAGQAAASALHAALDPTRLELVGEDSTGVALSQVDPPPAEAVDRLVAIRVGEILGADAVVYGSVNEIALPGRESVNQGALGLSVRIVSVETGQLLFTGSYSASGGGGDSNAVVKRLAAKCAEHIVARVGG